MNFFENDHTFDYALDRGVSQKNKDLEVMREWRAKEQKKELKKRIKKAKSITNHLARTYNLTEPNNPEALKADRKNCFSCGERLHEPDAYKKLPEETQKVYGKDEDIKHLCCSCFLDLEVGKEIIPTRESSKKVRMRIYDPEKAVKLGYDRIKRIKRMIASYPQCILVGTFKHDELDDESIMENMFLSRYSTRWG